MVALASVLPRKPPIVLTTLPPPLKRLTLLIHNQNTLHPLVTLDTSEGLFNLR